MISTFHLNCLRTAPPEPGAGVLMFALRRPLALRGPEPDEITTLIEGQLLLTEPASCVREALDRHLNGTCAQSDFRYGVAALLGLTELASDPASAHDLETSVSIFAQSIAIVHIVYGEVGDIAGGLFADIAVGGLPYALASWEP